MICALNVNDQKRMEQELQAIARSGKTPHLLLHSCCAPCSTSVIERLAVSFEMAVFYYNPNIFPEVEYEKRKSDQIRLLSDPSYPHRVSIVDSDYDPDAFDRAVRGLENEPEGGRRCERCFLLRLEETAREAKAGGFDYFTTTLTVSPHKNAGQINAIGEMLAEQYGVSYLFSDFKKKDGYKRSIALSETYGLYRQHYCGCQFSLPSGHSGEHAP